MSDGDALLQKSSALLCLTGVDLGSTQPRLALGFTSMRRVKPEVTALRHDLTTTRTCTSAFVIALVTGHRPCQHASVGINMHSSLFVQFPLTLNVFVLSDEPFSTVCNVLCIRPGVRVCTLVSAVNNYLYVSPHN